jgi:acetyltransferase-like isoleucine patch superfamily enzyme
MSNFALDVSSSAGDIISSLNYALANLGNNTGSTNANVLITNANGAVTSGNTIVSWLNRYIDVKYSNSATGSTGFTSNAKMANYYGIYNTNSNTVISTNPTDYNWTQVAGGFGNTQQLFYSTVGGRQIYFAVANVAPNLYYTPTIDNSPIDLDIVTGFSANAGLSIYAVPAYARNTTQPLTPTGGSWNFTTLTGTPPSGFGNTNIDGGTFGNVTSSAFYRTFLTSGTFTTNAAITADILVVGGGASGVTGDSSQLTLGGPEWAFHGGGGGQVSYYGNVSIPAGSYTVSVPAPPAVIPYTTDPSYGDVSAANIYYAPQNSPTTLTVGSTVYSAVAGNNYPLLTDTILTNPAARSGGSANGGAILAPTGSFEFFGANGVQNPMGSGVTWIGDFSGNATIGNIAGGGGGGTGNTIGGGFGATHNPPGRGSGGYGAGYQSGGPYYFANSSPYPGGGGGAGPSQGLSLAQRNTGSPGFVIIRQNIPTVTWNLSIPAGTDTLWQSQGVAAIQGTSGIDSNIAWTTPQQISGSSGTRGFIPMAYVLTATDPTFYTDGQYTAAFSAPRANVALPIGTGYTPVSGDVAQFYYGVGGANVSVVKTYSTSTVPQWQAVNGQVISGNVFVTGSINARALNANDVYALNIASTNATIGNNSSAGFWLSSNGDSRFGGNINIGNNLTVGNNAIIGGNVTIGGLVYQGNLVANVITPLQLAANSVTNLALANQAITNAKIALGQITGNLIASQTITGTLMSLNTITGNLIAQSTITGNLIVPGTITANLLAANAIVANTVVSSNSTLDDPAAPGFWLDGNTGSARFGGNISVGNYLTVGQNAQIGGNLNIGDNLIVGQNAQIGGNLNVVGLVNGGVLTANTVGYTQLQPGLIPSPAGNTYVATSATLNSSADYTGWYLYASTYNSWYKTLAYTQVNTSSAYYLPGATNPTFSINFGSTLTATYSSSGNPFLPQLFYYINAVGHGIGSNNPSNNSTTLHADTSLEQTTSWNGGISFVSNVSIPISYFSNTQPLVIGVALLNGNVANAAPGNWQFTNTSWTVRNA